MTASCTPRNNAFLKVTEVIHHLIEYIEITSPALEDLGVVWLVVGSDSYYSITQLPYGDQIFVHFQVQFDHSSSVGSKWLLRK